MYKCPKCRSTNLEVCVCVWARFKQYPDGTFETDTTEAFDDSHEWDGDSHMQCRDCNHTGKAVTFDDSAEPGVMFRCNLCKELINADDRLDHLIAHAPAYGGADDKGTPRATASMFEKVDLQETRREAADHLYESSDLLGFQVEGANGWESEGDNRVMAQVFFVSHGLAPSDKKTLTVRFKQASDKIEQADIDGEILTDLPPAT